MTNLQYISMKRLNGIVLSELKYCNEIAGYLKPLGVDIKIIPSPMGYTLNILNISQLKYTN